jgi:hypothetical protein
MGRETAEERSKSKTAGRRTQEEHTYFRNGIEETRELHRHSKNCDEILERGIEAGDIRRKHQLRHKAGKKEINATNFSEIYIILGENRSDK